MPPDDHRPNPLYDEDFYLWTQAQAEALRAREGGANRIDYDALAEEVEDLGRRDRNEAYSRTATVLEHLFKLAWSQQEQPKGGWRATVRTQRRDLKLVLTPSIRKFVEGSLDALHADAAAAASDSFSSDEPDARRDAALRWSLPQILGEENDPLA